MKFDLVKWNNAKKAIAEAKTKGIFTGYGTIISIGVIKDYPTLKKGIMQKLAEGIEEQEKKIQEKNIKLSQYLGLPTYKITKDLYTGYGSNIIYTGDTSKFYSPTQYYKQT